MYFLPTSLLALPPGPARGRIGARAGAAAALSVTAGALTGHTGLGVVAATGGLAALYGAYDRPRHEAAAVATAAVGLVLAMAVGSLAAGHAWTATAVVAAWVTLVTLACAALGARPPGILMFALVAALGSGLPAGGAPARMLGVAAAGALAAVLTYADRHLQTRRAPDPATATVLGQAKVTVTATGTARVLMPDPVAAPASRRTVPRLRLRLRLRLHDLVRTASLGTAARTGAAVLAAGALATAAGAERPYWAMATAAAVLGRGTSAGPVRERAVLRGAGTVTGTAVAAAVASLHPSGVAAGLVLGALIAVSELFVARNYFLAMLFVTPMAIVLAEASGAPADTAALLAARVVETLVGGAAAALVTLVPLPREPRQGPRGGAVRPSPRPRPAAGTVRTSGARTAGTTVSPC